MPGISCGSWAFALGPYAEAPVSLNRLAQALGEAGYEGIDLCGLFPHAPLNQYPHAGSRAALARMLGDHGLEVAGYAADFSTVNPVLEGNEQNYIDLFQRNVDLCVDLGSPSIRVDTVAPPGSVAERDYDAALDRLADTWADAAEIAARAKIRMLWEFEPGFLFNTPAEIVALHNRVGHSNFKLLFDTCDAYLCAVVRARQHGLSQAQAGGLPAFVKRLEGRIGAIHLADSDGTLYRNQSGTHCAFEDGYIDFRTLAPQLLDLPEVEWWCVDLSNWPESWEVLEESREFVEELMDAKPAA